MRRGRRNKVGEAMGGGGVSLKKKKKQGGRWWWDRRRVRRPPWGIMQSSMGYYAATHACIPQLGFNSFSPNGTR